MAKPTAKSTVAQMKDYIRANRLNKAPILLGMKRVDLIAGLRKLGHYDSRHDGVAPKRNPPAPKKPKEPVRAIADRPAPAPAPKKKKEQVDRIERAKLTREFQREHKTSVWKVLTLKPTATREAVKARGRELMRKHHPDKGGDKATFQRVQQAVKLLMDTFE